MKLGDKVKAVTEALGIEQCAPCKRRQQRLNDWGEWLAGVFVARPRESQTMTPHEIARAQAATAVLDHWRRLAASARAAGMAELAEKAEEQVRIREATSGERT